MRMILEDDIVKILRKLQNVMVFLASSDITQGAIMLTVKSR